MLNPLTERYRPLPKLRTTTLLTVGGSLAVGFVCAVPPPECKISSLSPSRTTATERSVL